MNSLVTNSSGYLFYTWISLIILSGMTMELNIILHGIRHHDTANCTQVWFCLNSKPLTLQTAFHLNNLM